MNNKANTEGIKNIILQVKIPHRCLKPRTHPKACGCLCPSLHRLVKMDRSFYSHCFAGLLILYVIYEENWHCQLLLRSPETPSSEVTYLKTILENNFSGSSGIFRLQLQHMEPNSRWNTFLFFIFKNTKWFFPYLIFQSH